MRIKRRSRQMLTRVDVNGDGLHSACRLHAAERLGRRPPECLACNLVVGENDRHARLSSHAEGLWWQGSREKTGVMSSKRRQHGRTAGWEDGHQETTARGQRWVCLPTVHRLEDRARLVAQMRRVCQVQQQHCSAPGGTQGSSVVGACGGSHSAPAGCSSRASPMTSSVVAGAAEA